jgi:hypothetical protein
VTSTTAAAMLPVSNVTILASLATANGSAGVDEVATKKSAANRLSKRVQRVALYNRSHGHRGHALGPILLGTTVRVRQAAFQMAPRG